MDGTQKRRPSFLAADRLSAASTCLTSPRQTRTGGFRCTPSGRKSRRGRLRSMFTPGSRACVYKIASGQGKWSNRDPKGEWSDLNLYRSLANRPITLVDPFGLDLFPGINLPPLPIPPGRNNPPPCAPWPDCNRIRTPRERCEDSGGRWLPLWRALDMPDSQTCARELALNPRILSGLAVTAWLSKNRAGALGVICGAALNRELALVLCEESHGCY